MSHSDPKFPNFLYSSLILIVPTVSPVKLNNESSCGWSSASSMSRCLNVFQNKMSIELSRLISAFQTTQLLISTYYGIILNWIYCLEIHCCENYGWHLGGLVWGNHVNRAKNSKMSFPSRSRVLTSCKLSSNFVDDTSQLMERFFFPLLLRSTFMPFKSWIIITIPTFVSVIIFADVSCIAIGIGVYEWSL